MNIKALIFDVDGTLYKTDPKLSNFIKNWTAGKVACHLGLGTEQVEDVLVAKKAETGSTTKALEALGIGSILVISQELNKASAAIKTETIGKDPELLELIGELRKQGLRLFTLRNGISEETVETLRLLGFTDETLGGTGETEKNCIRNAEGLGSRFGPFEALIPTVETGRMKPDIAIFESFLKTTKIPAEECLIIGDRINVDLTPAKKLGMKTALVTWGERQDPHSDVDFYLESVYDIQKLLHC